MMGLKGRSDKLADLGRNGGRVASTSFLLPSRLPQTPPLIELSPFLIQSRAGQNDKPEGVKTQCSPSRAG